jgi:hypothetical protein
VPVAVEPAALLPGSWRRWEQAFEACDSGDEAENFQAVGMRLRECLLSFVDETCSDELVVPNDATPPKRGDFKNWTDLLATALVPGPSAAKLRPRVRVRRASFRDGGRDSQASCRAVHAQLRHLYARHARRRDVESTVAWHDADTDADAHGHQSKGSRPGHVEGPTQ